MLTPKVRLAMKLLDMQFEQRGLPCYQDLEKSFDEAHHSGNKIQAGTLSLEMGERLLTVAISSQVFAQQAGLADSMPTPAEVFETAIDRFEYTLAVALNLDNPVLEKLARNHLAECFFETRQLETALEHLKRLHEICGDEPEDERISYSAAQKTGDLYYHLEDDKTALTWYQRSLHIAQKIDDPIEIGTQQDKIATTLRNLKRYDEALQAHAQFHEILTRVAGDESLQRKITVHKHLFTPSIIPDFIAHSEKNAAQTRESAGRELLRELPEQLATRTIAAIHGQTIPEADRWPVYRVLDEAVRAAVAVLREMLPDPGMASSPDSTNPGATSTVKLVGDFARQHFGDDIQDPESLTMAARYLMQMDRMRRAAAHVRKAETSRAGPGPFGGGVSSYMVYLRSFVASARLPRYEIGPWGQVSFEELLACQLDLQLLIALGNVELEQFGPGRVPTTDENWRDVLRALVMEARWLLVIPAPTEGTSWEIEWVVVNKFLHKTFFIMPPPKAGEEVWWTENWRILKDWAVRLGIDLPEYSLRGAYSCCIHRGASYPCHCQIFTLPISVCSLCLWRGCHSLTSHPTSYTVCSNLPNNICAKRKAILASP